MRVLFTSTPLFGHFMPMLPLVDAAVEAGHEVVVATGSDLASLVSRRGLTLWQVGPSTAEVFARHAALPELTGASHLDLLRRDAIAIFGWPGYQRARELAALTKAWVPDLVVHDAADYAGYEAGVSTGALSVAHGFGPPMPHTVELIRDICTGAVEELGTPDRFDAVLASPYLDPWPPALRGDEAAPWAEVIAIRPEPRDYDPSDSLPAEVLAVVEVADRPLIYVTFGTVFGSAQTLQMVLDALHGLPCTVVATTGHSVDPATLGTLPANVLVVPFLPQQAVIARSVAVVSHAGSGTVLGALAARRPQVCLPQGADQFINADQVARHGAGIAIAPGERDAAAICSAVERVLDDGSYTEGAAALQNEIGTMTPAQEVLTTLQLQRR